MVAQDKFNVKTGLAIGNSLNELLRIVGHDLFLPPRHSTSPGVISGNRFDRLAGIKLEQLLEMVYTEIQVEIGFKELFGLGWRESSLRGCAGCSGREKLHQPMGECR